MRLATRIEPTDPHAAVESAFAPLRQAAALAARRRRRWLAVGALAASAAIGLVAYPILQPPVELQVDADAARHASTTGGPAPLGRDDTRLTAVSATLAQEPAGMRPRAKDATRPATAEAVRSVAEREAAPAAQRSRAGSAAPSHLERAPAATRRVEPSTGDDLAAAPESNPDPTVALGLAAPDPAPTAGDVPSAARGEAIAAPGNAKAPRASGCAVAAAVLGLCRRNPESE